MPASASALDPASSTHSGSSPSLVPGLSNFDIPTPITNVRLLICAPSSRRVISAESRAWTLAWRRLLPALDGYPNLIADEPIRREANRRDHPQQHAGDYPTAESRSPWSKEALAPRRAGSVPWCEALPSHGARCEGDRQRRSSSSGWRLRRLRRASAESDRSTAPPFLRWWRWGSQCW